MFPFPVTYQQNQDLKRHRKRIENVLNLWTAGLIVSHRDSKVDKTESVYTGDYCDERNYARRGGL